MTVRIHSVPKNSAMIVANENFAMRQKRLTYATRPVKAHPHKVTAGKRSYLSRIVTGLSTVEDDPAIKTIEIVNPKISKVFVLKKPLVPLTKGVTPSPPPPSKVLRPTASLPKRNPFLPHISPTTQSNTTSLLFPQSRFNEARKVTYAIHPSNQYVIPRSVATKAITTKAKGNVAPKVKGVSEQREFKDFGSIPDHIVLSNITQRLETDYNSFTFRLHKILEQAESNGYSHVISWLGHGRAFIINDEKLFESIIVKNYFGSGFVESLKSRGFGRFFVQGVGGKTYVAYYHELFLRGRRELCAGISIHLKPNRPKEPKFYMLPPLDSIARKNMVEISKGI